MKYLLKEVAQIIKGRILQGNPNLVCAGASTDSRQVLEGDIFFCLIGERSDGHDFIKQARDNGAVAAVIEHDVTPPDGSIVLIEVESTLSALSVLAHYHRTKTRVNVIGVTGSVGKTSTKDIVHSVLSQRFRTYKNPGNLNSHIGLPLAVLGMVSDYDNAVLEMAMRKRGEITQLCEIALPSYGVITDISASHIGVVGSMDDIALGKAELLDYLPSNGKAFLCFDNNIIKDISHRARCPVVYYGFGEGADYMGFDVKNNHDLRSVFKVLHKGNIYEFKLGMPGLHQVQNALCAIAMGFEFGLTYEEISRGLDAVTLSPMRQEIIKLDDILIINDAYNSSPKSAAAALDLLARLPGKRKIAILGDMLELGDLGPEAHRQVGRICALSADYLFAAGNLSKYMYEAWCQTRSSETSLWCENKDKVIDCLHGFLLPGDTLLIKASRSVGFETIVDYIKKHFRQYSG